MESAGVVVDRAVAALNVPAQGGSGLNVTQIPYDMAVNLCV